MIHTFRMQSQTFICQSAMAEGRVQRSTVDRDLRERGVEIVRLIARFLNIGRSRTQKLPTEFLRALHELYPAVVSCQLNQQSVFEGILTPLLDLGSGPFCMIRSKRNMYATMDDAEEPKQHGILGTDMPVNYMKLPITEKSMSVYQMIEDEHVRAPMPDDYKHSLCGKVDERGNIFSQFFHRFGEKVSVFEIQRVDAFLQRVQTPIAVNERMFFDGSTWNITSLIHHIGNAKGGHYVTYVKREGVWWLINDESVTEADPELKKNTNVVCVAYCRKGMGGDAMRPLHGLGNMGNTCWLNSGLQLLLNTPSFVLHLKDYMVSIIKTLTVSQMVSIMYEPVDHILGFTIEEFIAHKDPEFSNQIKSMYDESEKSDGNEGDEGDEGDEGEESGGEENTSKNLWGDDVDTGARDVLITNWDKKKHLEGDDETPYDGANWDKKIHLEGDETPYDGANWDDNIQLDETSYDGIFSLEQGTDWQCY